MHGWMRLSALRLPFLLIGEARSFRTVCWQSSDAHMRRENAVACPPPTGAGEDEDTEIGQYEAAQLSGRANA